MAYTRKQYLVDKGLQLRFARFMILFVLVVATFTGGTIFYTTFLMLGEKLADVYPQGRLEQIYHSAIIALIVDAALVVPFILYFSIKFSHRISGPLAKMYTAVRQIGDGNYDVKLVLRKTDELKDLAQLINEMAEKLKQRETSK